MIIKYIIYENDIVKDFLMKQNISRKLGRKIKLYGNIYINGESAKNWFELKPGDELVIEYYENNNDEIMPSNHELNIIFEDEYLLIVNKPYNLSTQPSKKHYEDNLISRVKAYYLQKGIKSNIHIVNRLDYSTSGLMIVAKEGYIHHQLYLTDITKKYLAKVKGIIREEYGIIRLPISKLNTHNIKRVVDEEGQEAITEYKLLRTDADSSLLELTLITGRCHQIRVHLSSIGYSIIGDKLYGEEKDILYLHSYYLNFIHPITKETMEFTNLPNWL